MYSTSETPNVKQCATCGESFMPPRNRPDKKYCSDACRSKAYISPYWYTCQRCGKEYRAKKKDRAAFCSRECFAAHIDEHGRPERRKAKQPRPVSLCTVCGKPCKGNGAKRCSEECRKKYNRQRAREHSIQTDARDRSQRACKECGALFVPEYGNQRRWFCSDECLRRRARRTGKATRRARIQGAPLLQSIDPIDVCQRDRWTCYLCGCSTPRELRGTTDERAPEIDHVVPLSRGGTHSYDNVRCACRACNQRKGTKTWNKQGYAP